LGGFTVDDIEEVGGCGGWPGGGWRRGRAARTLSRPWATGGDGGAALEVDEGRGGCELDNAMEPTEATEVGQRVGGRKRGLTGVAHSPYGGAL
jgi:hypothetical protein